MSKSPPGPSAPKSRRGYVLIPAGLLASALTGGGAGWAGGRNAAPAAVAAPAPVQVCEDFGSAVKALQAEVTGLTQREHDRDQREKTLAEFERRIRDLREQVGPGPLKR